MFLPAISADLIVTEVMHTPNQTARQSTAEWFEIYNTGDEYIDLGEWVIEGRTFNDVILPPKTYLVVARRLIDPNDPTGDSFECWWGNCNGIWDEPYLAVDGSFVLTVSDTITLQGPNHTFVLEYDEWYGHKGDGKTMALIDYSCPLDKECWIEGVYGGTPGRGEIDNDEVFFRALLGNVPPEIISAEILTDDSIEPGIQIIPEYNKPKIIEIQAKLNKNSNIEQVIAELNERTYVLDFNSSTSEYELYRGKVEMMPNESAGDYEISIKVFEGDYFDEKKLSFRYEALIATVLKTTEIYFGELRPGQESKPQEIIIKNTGNSDLDIKLEVNKLNSDNKDSLQGNFYIFSNKTDWQNIIDMKNFNIGPGKKEIFKIKLNMPTKVDRNTLEGTLRILSLPK